MVADHLWATSYALKASDLFTKFDYPHKLKTDIKSFPSKYANNPIWFVSLVFRYFFYLLIIDIIENKVTFKLPRTSRAYIEMMPTSGEEFIKARLNGAFLDVDFLVSDFTGYNICLRFNTRYGKWMKALHITEKYKDRITFLTNSGHGW